ncbi:MAG: 4-alpha-glucanotransferase [Planctomycetaceae bacterium]
MTNHPPSPHSLTPAERDLRHLARLYGVIVEYRDVDSRPQRASEKALVRALQLLDCPIQNANQAAESIATRRTELWNMPLPPVVVAWDGELEIAVRLPASAAKGKARCRIELEEGEPIEWDADLAAAPATRAKKIDRTSYVVKRIRAPRELPSGYHRLRIELPANHSRTAARAPASLPRQRGEQSHEALVLSAPRVAYADEKTDGGDAWGVFLPLYALHSERSWGAGNLTDLERLIDWVSSLGGNLVATLPLLASEIEFRGDPSPYSPTSRLVWNELYVDIERATGIDDCAAAKKLVASRPFQRELGALRRSELVDYDRQWKLQQQVLELLADDFFERADVDRVEFDEFVKSHPRAVDYCRYKAVRQRNGAPWPIWPARLRKGDVREGDYVERTFRRYLFAQWQIHRQLHRLAEKARRDESLWYLDFPLGVNRFGFDTWRNSELFALDASGGAPPDAFFTKGQNWGFPPLHPRKLREDGYRYFIDCLRMHFEYARILRIDHVMGLHRLYWVPEGFPGRDGVYVRYHRDELFAVLSLESHRYKARIVGENLGTVPDAVNTAMEAHGLMGMYVLQFAANSTKRAIHPLPPENAIASLNTHDIAPFTTFWTGLDIDSRFDLDLLDEAEARDERDELARVRRAMAAFLKKKKLLGEDITDPRRVMQACQNLLASSPAKCVLLNLEDLWLETLPQNTPGTSFERPNWRRKARYALEDFSTFGPIVEMLKEIDRRRGGRMEAR